ncbi:MAG: PspA/IM30 family protein [Pseudomonadota bacterium]
MGIFQRMMTVIKANINALIGRAENPEKVLDQLLVEMRGQLAKTKQDVAAAIADEKKLQAQVEKEKKAAEDWERRAMLAVQEGRDDLAKQALMRHNEHLQHAQHLHETWVKHKADVESLKSSLRELNDKIEEAKRKKNLLVARQKRAEAQQRIQRTMSSMSDKSAFRMALTKAEVESVRGNFRFGSNHHPIQDVYVRQVYQNDKGELTNKIVGKVFTDHQDAYAKDCKM